MNNSSSQSLGEALLNLPAYLWGYATGLLYALVTIYDATTCLIFAVLVGLLAHSILVGAATFFGVYLVARFASMIPMAIMESSQLRALPYPQPIFPSPMEGDTANTQSGVRVREGN